MKKGFTLIELLVVIVIIAILAAVIFVALNPIARFAEARNSQRWNAVNSILSAVHLCINDNAGILADCNTDLGDLAADTETELSTTADVSTCSNASPCSDGADDCLDLSSSLAAYLAEMPTDPGGGLTASHTGYTLEVTSAGVIYIRACHEEEGTTETPDIYVAR